MDTLPKNAIPSTDTRPAGFGVNVIGFTTASLGLGVAARATIATLLDAQIPVAVAELGLPDGRSGVDNTYAYLQIPNPSVPQLPHPVTVVCVNPNEAAGVWHQYSHWFAETYNLILPFWELPSIPDQWIPRLADYDVILAASEHIAGAIRNSLSNPVRRFPLAAEMSNVEPVERSDFGIPDDKVVFAATWDTNSGLGRKNTLGVVRAFQAALELGADAVLVAKTNGGVPDPRFKRAVAQLPEDRVIVVSDYLPYARVLGLYSVCDAFISLHRAEGLGLGLQEAMSLGKPVIGTGWSGNMDFMDESCAVLIPYTLTPVVDANPAYSAPHLVNPQLWAEPDILDAARQIFRLTQDAELRRALGRAGEERMARYRAAWKIEAPRLLTELYRSHLSALR